MFLNSLPTDIHSVVRTFWEREQNAHLLEIDQYEDTLLQVTRQVSSTIMASVQKNRFRKGRRAAPTVPALAAQRFGSLRKYLLCLENTRGKVFFHTESL